MSPTATHTSTSAEACACSCGTCCFHFFDLWAGKRDADTFHRALHHDLGELFALLAHGTVTAPIDSIYPLIRAGAALRRAEEGNVAGKIIVCP